MIVDKLEDTLNGGYGGLYGEVVTEDIYGLRKLDFIPDVIYDIGANVGVFSRFARSLFPEALIIAVEPDPENVVHFRKFTNNDRTLLLEMALGQGQVYHATTAKNGAHEVYHTIGLGYQELMKQDDIKKVSIPSIMLDELCILLDPNVKMLMKIDCEGAENFIWQHEPSMRVLRRADYIAMELHFYGMIGREIPNVIEVTEAALASFWSTHYCCRKSKVYFQARKR